MHLSFHQEPGGFRKRAGCGPGRPRGLPGLRAARPGLLHWHLGLSVLPRHRELPVFPAEGERSTSTAWYRSTWLWKEMRKKVNPAPLLEGSCLKRRSHSFRLSRRGMKARRSPWGGDLWCSELLAFPSLSELFKNTENYMFVSSTSTFFRCLFCFSLFSECSAGLFLSSTCT